jgi:hypothetical protein
MYPVRLNGIIREDEFQESIRNINRILSLNKYCIIKWIIGIICLLCMVGAILVLSIGLPATKNSNNSAFYAFLIAGFALFILGTLMFGVCNTVDRRRKVRIEKVIDNESKKYSSRSPVPCTWRLSHKQIYSSPDDDDPTTINVVSDMFLD